MKNLPLLIATVLGTLALVIGVAVFFSQPEQVAAPANEALVLGEREVSQSASQSAEATIAVFSDFECPACASLELGYLIKAREQYGDRLRIVYRHFPLETIHPYARITAMASEAARSESKFWEYHDLLFARQAEWSGLSSLDAVKDTLIAYAEELQIDKEKFIAKMESDEVKKIINADLADGYALQTDSTPTVFVNNIKTAPQDLPTQIELLLAN